MTRRALVLSAMILLVSPVFATEIPQYMAQPLDRILTDYRTAASIEGNGNAALEEAYSKVQAALQ